jgi:ComF family protein
MTEPVPSSDEPQARPKTPTRLRPALGFFVWARRQLEHGLDALFPEGCAHCQAQLTTPGNLLCERCADAVVPGPYRREVSGVPALAPFAYCEPVRHALHRFKFQNHPELGRRFGRLMAPLMAELPNWQTLQLVPVPAHPVRVVERGYNQAALLAGAVAGQTGLRHVSHWLRRTRLGEQQSRLGGQQRRCLEADDFVVRGAGPRRPVCLVDDVLTTGSTVAACIACLRAAGADVAGVLTIAQVEGPPPAS